MFTAGRRHGPHLLRVPGPARRPRQLRRRGHGDAQRPGGRHRRVHRRRRGPVDHRRLRDLHASRRTSSAGCDNNLARGRARRARGGQATSSGSSASSTRGAGGRPTTASTAAQQHRQGHRADHVPLRPLPLRPGRGGRLLQHRRTPPGLRVAHATASGWPRRWRKAREIHGDKYKKDISLVVLRELAAHRYSESAWASWDSRRVPSTSCSCSPWTRSTSPATTSRTRSRGSTVRSPRPGPSSPLCTAVSRDRADEPTVDHRTAITQPTQHRRSTRCRQRHARERRTGGHLRREPPCWRLPQPDARPVRPRPRPPLPPPCPRRCWSPGRTTP